MSTENRPSRMTELADVAFGFEDPPLRFKVIPRRRWTLVAEYLSNGQLTARWFYDNDSGAWYVAESWKRPRLSTRLNADSVSYILGVLGMDPR